MVLKKIMIDSVLVKKECRSMRWKWNQLRCWGWKYLIIMFIMWGLIISGDIYEEEWVKEGSGEKLKVKSCVNRKRKWKVLKALAIRSVECEQEESEEMKKALVNRAREACQRAKIWCKNINSEWWNEEVTWSKLLKVKKKKRVLAECDNSQRWLLERKMQRKI